MKFFNFLNLKYNKIINKIFFLFFSFCFIFCFFAAPVAAETNIIFTPQPPQKYNVPVYITGCASQNNILGMYWPNGSQFNVGICSDEGWTSGNLVIEEFDEMGEYVVAECDPEIESADCENAGATITGMRGDVGYLGEKIWTWTLDTPIGISGAVETLTIIGNSAGNSAIGFFNSFIQNYWAYFLVFIIIGIFIKIFSKNIFKIFNNKGKKE